MRVIVRKTYEDISREAALLVKARLLAKPDLVLGLATGSSPVGMYRELVRLHREEGLSFKKARSFNLDEYYGLEPAHEQSYRRFMNENLFDHIDVDKRNTLVPDGTAKDIDRSCAEYEREIRKAGGIDLQVLGIGSDGHIAFNEPGSALRSRTRLVALDEVTVRDNARFFAKVEDVPRFAISMGVGTILEAKELLFIANGAKKAAIVAKALEGPITSLISGTVLQLHPRVTAFLDEGAAASLARLGYYRFAEESERAIGRQIF